MPNSSTWDKSLLHGLIYLVNKGLQKLNVSLNPEELESIGVTVYNVMEARWRKYHSIDHVITICDTEDPIQIIAGVFHDTTYLQIDRRIHPRINQYLKEFTEFGEAYSITIPLSNPNAANKSLLVVNEIFGVQPGQVRDVFSGANEYLSALVAVRLL